MPIRINDKQNCYGCAACANICPNECIQMVENQEGFYIPKVNSHTCTECGKCIDVCGMNTDLTPNNSFNSAYLFIHGNHYKRMLSSSGGFVNALSEFLFSGNEKMTVYGATFDENYRVYHKGITQVDDLFEIMGSKYVQSFISEKCMREVKTKLEEGEIVLFVGTPCQIAGLVSFLGKEYDKLITIELICEGVPSPKVWSAYLEEYWGE